MQLLDSTIAKAIFGGNPRENERRYNANAQLRDITRSVYPWTVEALREAVADWLENNS